MQIIAHNILSQFSNRQLNITSKNKAKNTERLSSGFKINRSADDAAGLQISEKLRWQIRGLNKGSDNVQDGCSLLMVADGALAEVHNMLHRMEELAVQAANDSNTKEDREAIQKELDVLVEEIDRIGEDTEFNTKKIFTGGYAGLVDANGNPVSLGNIPMSGFQLGRADLMNYPFTAGSSSDYLRLAVSTTGAYSMTATGNTSTAASAPVNWGLVYGDGGTSHTAIRVTYDDGAGNAVVRDCELRDLGVSNVVVSADGTTCSRVRHYDSGDGVEFDITENVVVQPHTGQEQYYKLTYDIESVGAKDARMEFMFNCDTAYNNDDHCEKYFIDGNFVSRSCMYTDNAGYQAYGNSNVHGLADLAGTSSFSIINDEAALPFSVKVKWDSANVPNTLCIGDWSAQCYWSYYDNLNSSMGHSLSRRDVSFGMIWEMDIASGDSKNVSLEYGIAKADADPNLRDVPITYSTLPQVRTDHLDLWIQSGEIKDSGYYITIGAMNSQRLGLDRMDVKTHRGAAQAMSDVAHALDKLSHMRSSIGAQQNRLETSRLINDNTHENAQAAESRLRDADMAKEMVEYSKHSILEQAGQAMLAQANQSPQGILTLLS